jgi:colanic acid/amylovoran biosynthesis protein
MAGAIAERLRVRFPGVRLVVPHTFGDFQARAQYCFYTHWEFEGGLRGSLKSNFFRRSPTQVRAMAGMIDPAEVDVVLDASGFAFSDQWGTYPVKTLLHKMQQPARRHQPLVLLPQALGAFEKPDVARACRLLFERAELVCARDETSLKLVQKLGGARALRKYPDFTVAVSPASHSPELPEAFSAIVPNIRMLDKAQNRTSYLAFLNHAVERLISLGANPLFVLHDSEEDRRVIERLSASAASLQVVEHSDPRVLKAVLGKASLVIGSRFHALVSSLSQGVPCIGAGWSHKYPELFKDFGCEQFVASDLADWAQLDRLLEELADATAREKRSVAIRSAAKDLKTACESMWSEVEAIIRGTVRS